MRWSSVWCHQARRAYATALMDTLDFLCDGFIAPPLGATAAKSSTLLARRIAMMKDLLVSCGLALVASCSCCLWRRSDVDCLRRQVAR